MLAKLFLVYETAMGYLIFVEKNKRSGFDFKVKYCLAEKKLISPKYLPFAIDLYTKMSGNKQLTLELIDHFIELIVSLPREQKFLPELLSFNRSNASKYSPLDIYGEYSAEFLLITFELFLRQKKWEYPKSKKSLNLLQSLRRQDDIYTLIKTIL
jgi:hypothetical protein